MYLQEYIGTWTSLEWNKFFTYWKHLTDEDKQKIKVILKWDKQAIEESFHILKDMWLLNGIWPSWFPPIIRIVLTWLFPYFRWEWHDLMYSIWGTAKDRHKSDLWALKYTLISITNDVEKAIDEGKTLKLIYKSSLSLVIRAFISLTFYLLLRLFGSIAFNNNS